MKRRAKAVWAGVALVSFCLPAVPVAMMFGVGSPPPSVAAQEPIQEIEVQVDPGGKLYPGHIITLTVAAEFGEADWSIQPGPLSHRPAPDGRSFQFTGTPGTMYRVFFRAAKDNQLLRAEKTLTIESDGGTPPPGGGGDPPTPPPDTSALASAARIYAMNPGKWFASAADGVKSGAIDTGEKLLAAINARQVEQARPLASHLESLTKQHFEPKPSGGRIKDKAAVEAWLRQVAAAMEAAR
jgi:hypothetical protein